MIKMPLFPRCWLFPRGSAGAAHSMCSCTSPNFCLVMWLPVPGTTSMYPFSTFQVGAEVSPRLRSSQFDKSRPSKSMIASDGGKPGLDCVLAVPGSTKRGLGLASSCTRQRSPGRNGVSV